MKIGIFGGSFNPPHFKHKKVALDLVEEGYVDKVIFVPTGNKYKKDSLIDDDYRFEMLKLICDKEYLSVCDFELQDELKYTYQTLDYFKSIYPDDDLYFILGFDNLAYFHKWKKYEYILKNYKLLVISRGDRQSFENLKPYLENIIFTNLVKEDVSSGEIRDELRRYRYSDKVEAAVLDYILENNLYTDVDNLYEYIFKRKSCRKFKEDKLEDNLLKELTDKIGSFNFLNEKIDFQISLSTYEHFKGLTLVKAPHYLVVRGNKTAKNMLELGFILQKWTLWLSYKGIGSVWLGGADFKGFDDVIIIIGLGYAQDDLYRLTLFKRKKLNEIYNGKSSIFEASRYAQSGINLQPWYFLEKDKEVFVFKKKIGLLNKVYHLQDLDMGIVLANTYISYIKHKKSFRFSYDNSETLSGYVCIGKIF